MERSNAEDSELEQLEASVVEASWRNAQRFGVVGSLAIGVSMRVEMGEITLSELVVVAWCSLCVYMQLARKIQKAKLMVRVPHLIRFIINAQYHKLRIKRRLSLESPSGLNVESPDGAAHAQYHKLRKKRRLSPESPSELDVESPDGAAPESPK